MSQQYMRLHNIRATRASRWGADNPEACGILCVVSVVGCLLMACAVLPVAWKGIANMKDTFSHPQSKALVILGATSTSTTVAATTTTSVITSTPKTTALPTTTRAQTPTTFQAETSIRLASTTTTRASSPTTTTTGAHYTTSGHVLQTSPENDTDLGWITPPAGCCEGERPSIITYTGEDKEEYIDGGVMLGLSLQWHVPEFPRLCLVVETMSETNKNLLQSAGWTLIEVKDWHPLDAHFANDYWWDVYGKANVFRINVSRALWMDADMYVWDDALREVLEATTLAPGHIAMVKDCMSGNYNTGLMFFEPSLAVFRHIRSGMAENAGWDGLDQPLINKEYSGRIVELDAKFNTHGTIKPCKGVVAAHYTGKKKPTLADAANLKLVSTGYQSEPFALECPELYKQYFCALLNAKSYLSDELQAALEECGIQAVCHIY